MSQKMLFLERALILDSVERDFVVINPYIQKKSFWEWYPYIQKINSENKLCKLGIWWRFVRLWTVVRRVRQGRTQNYFNKFMKCTVMTYRKLNDTLWNDFKPSVNYNQGGHGTGKTGNLVLTFSRQGKHREFCCNTGKVFETQGKYFWLYLLMQKACFSLHIFKIF